MKELDLLTNQNKFSQFLIFHDKWSNVSTFKILLVLAIYVGSKTLYQSRTSKLAKQKFKKGTWEGVMAKSSYNFYSG